MKLQKTLSEILASNLLTNNAKNWARDNFDYLTQVDTPLINVNSSAKIVKGKKLNINTGILYLKPADSIAAITICAGADLAKCKDICLESSGQLGMQTGDNAKIKRTICYLLEIERFYDELRAEITRHNKRHGNTLVIRLNGTSDIDFSDFIASMPQITFYDYTKIYARLIKNNLANYDLTFSASAANSRTIKQSARAITNNYRVVLAMNNAETIGEKPIKKRLGDIKLIDMDTTDARFLDKPDAIGFLKRKGSNKKQRLADSERANFFFNDNSIKALQSALKGA